MTPNNIKISFSCFLLLAFFTFNSAKGQFEPPVKGDYFNKNKINFLFGGNNYNRAKGLNFSTINGIQVSDHLAAGIGIGFTDGVKYESPIIPVFLNGTLSLTGDGKMYLSGDLGYSFATEKLVKGGMLGEISLGRKIRIGKFAIAPEIGYRFDGYKGRGVETVELDGQRIIRVSNSNVSKYVDSFSTGLSVFF